MKTNKIQPVINLTSSYLPHHVLLNCTLFSYSLFLQLSNDNTLKRLKQQEAEWKKKLELEQDKLKDWQKKYEESEKEKEVIHSNKKEVVHMPLKESWQAR